MPKTFPTVRNLIIGAIIIALSGILFHNYVIAAYYLRMNTIAQVCLFLGILLLVFGVVLTARGIKEYLKMD